MEKCVRAIGEDCKVIGVNAYLRVPLYILDSCSNSGLDFLYWIHGRDERLEERCIHIQAFINRLVSTTALPCENHTRGSNKM